MLKKVKSSIAIVLTFMMSFSMFGVTYAKSSDYEAHWAAKEITKWQSLGIIKGYPDGSFKPNNQITRAEFFKVVAETVGITETTQVNFSDVKEDAWYKPYISKAVAAGYVQGDGDRQVRPNDPITRQEAAKVLAVAFGVQTSENAASNFKDANKIADWSKGYVGGLARNGYINGYNDGSFKPANYITRAESVKMFDNLAGELYNQAGIFSDKNIEGNVTINTPDVTLKNITIGGNLYLAKGIGEGNVVLENVTVKGETLINGGGENSIYGKDSTFNTITIGKKGGKIRIVMQGSSTANRVVLQSGAKLETVGGTSTQFKDVIIEQAIPEGEEVVLNGNFGTVTIHTAKVLITTFKNTNVMNFKALAEGIKVNGQNVAKDSTVKIENGNINGADTNPTGGGAGGSGSNSGGSGGSGGSSNVNVARVSLNQATATLKVGETVTLTATVSPANATNKSVTWRSSNESVAVVENGRVIGIAAGTADIIVTTADGNKTAKCTVTVTESTPIKEATIYGVNTSIDTATKKIVVEGYISSGSGKQVTIKVYDPNGEIDYINQKASTGDGKFTFEFMSNSEIAGTYTVRLGAQGLTVPVETEFEY